MLVTPRDHPLQARSELGFEDTLDHDYIGLRPGTQLSLQLIRSATELGRHWPCRIQVSSYDALCLMVEAGLGIAILPRRLALSYSRALHIRPVELREPWARRTFEVCCRPPRELASSTRLLLDHLLASSSPDPRAVS